mmetsp:Transcript_41992/g.101184  ORF Transcript_41992/g.101184 Transcript_41992/m.101184 type:complete len:1373 (+) Transcript_41992:2978-7096(+)
MPGTSHALVPGTSLDKFRQEQLIRTSIENITRANTSRGTTIPDDPKSCQSPPSDLRNEPYCFVVDTDAKSWLVDSGANRIIVTDPKMLNAYQLATGAIKGIHGEPARIVGKGKLPLNAVLPLPGIHLEVDAVCLPTSPFNILPPQLLYRKLKAAGLQPKLPTHSDTEYVFEYTLPGENRISKFTAQIDGRDLFTFRSEAGYGNFCMSTSQCESNNNCDCVHEWHAYSGTDYYKSRATVVSRESESEGALSSTSDSEGALPISSSTSEGARSISEGAPSTISASEGAEHSNPHKVTFEDPEVEEGARVFDPSIAITRRKQHRLFVLHEKYGHLPFSKLQLMARAGMIPKELANIDPPTCPGCSYGKAHRKPWRGKGSNRRRIKPAVHPGQVVSVDQLVSPTPGFVPTHRGNPTLARYVGATVFVDHFSDFTYIHLMTEMNADATVLAKLAFERECATHGVSIRHYHADNGLFDTKTFRNSVEKAGQGLTFCGVNAHHQNGKAERKIKEVTEGARTALIHAAHRWPQAIHASLWPAALKNYVNLKNALPTKFTSEIKVNGRKQLAKYEESPISKMAQVEVEPNLSHFHPFGAPVYVLEESLQAKHSHNKWTDRARVGIFLCHSPNHAANVPLILNTKTGLVSPQFHCIYDDAFDTCKRDNHFTSAWQRKARLHLDEKKKKEITTIPSTNLFGREHKPADAPLPNVPHFITQWDDESTIGELTDDFDIESAEPGPSIQIPNQGNAEPPPIQQPPTVPQPEAPRTTRAGRVPVPNPRYFNDSMIHANSAYLETFSPIHGPDIQGSELLQADHSEEPHAFASIFALAGTADPDTLTFAEAMKADDRHEFIKAMYKEIGDHIGRKHWKVVPIRSIPPHKRAIPMVWAMKRKKNPLGEIIKWKARLCAGGHRSIENVDYWDTYAPVVSWSTVRLMVIFALINDWHMESIDFVLAYPQAPIKTDIFMKPPEVPPKFVIPDMPRRQDRHLSRYKLLQNLYGLKDAGRTWSQYLHKGLIDRGWKQSNIDSCLYTKQNIILVLYVDDACILSPNKDLINKEIKSLQEQYKLTDDGELQDYLGTRFTKQADGSILLEQPRMINRILEMVGLTSDQVKTHDSPASSTNILDKDPDGDGHSYPWNYRSVVGSLSYLQAMIRPDITMAVQQCARFCNDPKESHAAAVKRICRYLHQTRNKGLCFKPDPTKGLECYVDADWAGSWQDRTSTDPLSARSRTGYIITYAGCPVVWASKLQTLVALSTTEAEYIALSTSLREVIAVMNLVNELQSLGFQLSIDTPKIVCTVFEDNRSCLEIATNHRTRPRTKHLSVRLHHFRSHVLDQTIIIKHVSTKEQMADIFTKPLPRDQFIKLRNRFMGWDSLGERE